MSQDILIRGSRKTTCNGAYVDYAPDVVSVYARQWLAYDKTCVIRSVVDTDTAIRYWILGSADYDQINEQPSQSSSEIYFRAPALIDETDIIEREPWDVNLVWEDLTGITPVSVLSVLLFDAANVVIEASAPVTADDGSVTTSITYTDILTGNVWKETSVVREKVMPVLQVEDRYISHKPVVGRVYRFQFVRDFKQLGYLPPWEITQSDIGNTVLVGSEQVVLTSSNIDEYLGQLAHDVNYQPSGGVYKVSRVMAYTDVLLLGVDIFNNIYVRCNVSKDTYEKDLELFPSSTFYLLTCPVDSAVMIYVPDAFFAAQPDESVNPYDKMLLTVDLGIHSDPDMLSDMQSVLASLLEKKWGISDPAGELLKVSTYGTIWLTDEDYALLNTSRNDTIRNSPIRLADLFCYNESNNLYKELLVIQNKLKAYEEIIAQRSDQ